METPFACERETEEALIPSMILQPLMENALVHGVRAKRAVVAISAKRTASGALMITVTDNGAGMPEETLRLLVSTEEAVDDQGEMKASGGVGVRNVRDRLALIYGSRAGFDIKSAPGRGTEVTIMLPLMYEETDPDKPGGA